MQRSSIILTIVICAGCGGGGEDGRSETVPVTGTVLYQDAPVADALVTFHGGPRQAVGRTDEDGRFTLTTYDKNDGAVAGVHVVTVTKYEGGKAEEAQEPVSMEAALDQPTNPGAPKNLLPAKYSDSEKRVLVETVADGEDNDFELKLVD